MLALVHERVPGRYPRIIWVMLQYRQADPSHVNREWRRLHSEARAPLQQELSLGSGTCGLHSYCTLL